MGPLRQRAALAAPEDVVGEVLHAYAARGFLQGVGERPAPRGVEYRLQWHFDRVLTVLLDRQAGTLAFPELLPSVPARSAMYKAFRTFVTSFASPERPPHRRVDPRRAKILCSNRGGTIVLAMKVLDGDYEFATRKLVHVAHEVFMVFLRDGPYYEYCVAHLGLDPDAGFG